MATMSGKTCLVTGATSGIGKETAVRLAGEGATLIVPARTVDRGEAAADEIRRRVPGARVETLAADLSSMAQVRLLAEQVQARYDRLDVLVNNAGVIMMRRQPTVDGWESTLAINHLAPFLLTNLLRGLLERSAPARAHRPPGAPARVAQRTEHRLVRAEDAGSTPVAGAGEEALAQGGRRSARPKIQGSSPCAPVWQMAGAVEAAAAPGVVHLAAVWAAPDRSGVSCTCSCSSEGERLPYKQRAAGSNPAASTRPS